MAKKNKKCDLFAFDWDKLSEDERDEIGYRLRSKYGSDLEDKDLRRIFTCLVARDAEVPMPWIEVCENEGEERMRKERVFDEETFEWKTVMRVEKAPKWTGYIVHGYVGTDDDRKGWLIGSDGYAMFQAWNSNLMTNDRSEAMGGSLDRAVETCEQFAKQDLLAYIGGGVAKGNAADDVMKRVEERDWTKKGTVTVRKADFMKQPRYMEHPEWDYVDNELLDAIKEYRLPAEVDQDFIDWVAGGCEGSVSKNKPSKLSVNNFNVPMRVAFPELTRGDIVEFYHGIDSYVMDRLEPGYAFTCGRAGTKYVVFKAERVDGTKVVAFAKNGTTIDGDGFIDEDRIMYGIDADDVESCWDALYECNRIGKRKKIMKVRTVEAAKG